MGLVPTKNNMIRSVNSSHNKNNTNANTDTSIINNTSITDNNTNNMNIIENAAEATTTTI